MYVCMYVCMYVRMYVCKYVCIYIHACIINNYTHICVHFLNQEKLANVVTDVASVM